MSSVMRPTDSRETPTQPPPSMLNTQDALEASRTAPKPAQSVIQQNALESKRTAPVEYVVKDQQDYQRLINAAISQANKTSGDARDTWLNKADKLSDQAIKQAQTDFANNQQKITEFVGSANVAISEYNRISKNNEWGSYDWSKYNGGRDAYVANMESLKTQLASVEKDNTAYKTQYSQYISDLKTREGIITSQLREPEYVKNPLTNYTITYKDSNGTEHKATFPTYDEAVKFATKQSVSEAKYTFTDANGKKIPGSPTFTNPDQALRYSEAQSEPVVAKAGEPKGLSIQLFEWASNQGDPNWRSKPLTERTISDFVKSQGQYYGIALSPVLNQVDDVAKWAASLLKADTKVGVGTVGHETEKFQAVMNQPIQQITLDNMDKYASVAGISKPLLYTSVAGTSILLAYGEGLAAGAVTGRILTSAKEIAGSSATAGRLAIILEKIESHPKLAQALIWAPVVGVSAVEVYSDYSNGKSIDTILGNLAIRAGSMVSGFKGFSKGLENGLSTEELRTLNKIISKDGKITEEFQTRQAPKWFVEDILKGEVKPIKGDEIVVGFKSVKFGNSEIDVPVSSNFGKTLDDLMAGKKLGPIKYAEAIQSAMPPEDYGLLTIRYGKLTEYSPQELADLAWKELGLNSPWNIKADMALSELGLTDSKYKVIGVLAQDDAPLLKPSQIKLWNDVAEGKPTLWIPKAEGKTNSALTVAEKTYKELKGLNLSDSTVQVIMQESIKNGYASGIQAALKIEPSLTTSQVKSVAVLATIVSNMDLPKNLDATKMSIGAIVPTVAALADPATLNETATKLDSIAVSIVVPNLDVQAIHDLRPVTLMTIYEKSKFDEGIITDILGKTNTSQTQSLVTELTTSQVSDIATKIDIDQLQGLVSKLDIQTANVVLDTYINVHGVNTENIGSLPPMLHRMISDRLRWAEEHHTGRMLWSVSLNRISTWSGEAKTFHDALQKAMQSKGTSDPRTATIRRVS